MTLMLDLELDVLKMYVHIKNESFQKSQAKRERNTDRSMRFDATKRTSRCIRGW